MKFKNLIRLASMLGLFVLLAVSAFAATTGKNGENSKNYYAIYEKAYNCYTHKDYERAINLYNLSIKANSNYAPAWRDKGVALAAIGNNKEAIKCYRKALKLADDKQVYMLLSTAHYKEGNYRKALKDINVVIAHKPNWDTAYVNRGVIMVGRGKYDQALADYEKAYSLNADNYSARFGIANMLCRMQRCKEALKIYADLVAHDPADSNYLYNYAGALADLRYFLPASKILTKLLEKDSRNTGLLMFRGRCYYESNNFKAACTDFTQARHLGHPEAARMIEDYCAIKR